MLKMGREDLKKLLGIIIMSDGTISKSGKYNRSIKLETISYNKCQHTLFKKICRSIFNKNVSTISYKTQGRVMLCSRLYGKKQIEEMLKLSPTYQTTSGPNKSKEEFLQSTQPSISFINEGKTDIKKLALRIWFDFDGSIIPSFKIKKKRDKKKDRVYDYYQIQFECDINISETNPNLIKELLELCKSLELRAIIKKDKRKWSGIDGIRISELNSVKKFIEMGGPVTIVKISSKSHRLKGTTKRKVCKGVARIIRDVPLSYYFKDRKSAIGKKVYLDSLLSKYIKN